MITRQTPKFASLYMGSVVAAFAACMLLAGCQTTGDPNEGGLFGWSEDKARAREANLEVERDEARKSADAELQRGEDLSNTQHRLRLTVGELRAKVADVIAENDNLDREIRALLSKRRISEAELTRLRQTLAASRRASAEARHAAAETNSPDTEARLSYHSEAVSHYNDQLHRDVLLLMGR